MNSFHYFPVLPKPPSPLEVLFNSWTSIHCARSCLAITNWAIRSPSSILNSTADKLTKIITSEKPDFIFHLAAQALVRKSYDDPISTIKANTLGTASILDAIRRAKIEKGSGVPHGSNPNKFNQLVGSGALKSLIQPNQGS